MTEIAASLALLAMTRQVALLLNLSLRGEAVAISILDKGEFARPLTAEDHDGELGSPTMTSREAGFSKMSIFAREMQWKY